MVLLRVALVIIVIAFLGLLVRVASIGFGGSVRGIDRLDRGMQRTGMGDGAR